ncbi:hypothetical protein [Shewanella aestuarii]|uniref:Uncharacterized protein n=1 Tax=Shewanella aestuarii TaxID=1028752 RepID=A0A6G9QRC9_9GAMM|nr:hypothetical protein [Shewanella aestuarii]QIR16587.1 hypothetical protein HBH39_19115 [Shewanella aestuarii]
MNIHKAIENSALDSCVISQDHCRFIANIVKQDVAFFQLLASNYLKKFDSKLGRELAERLEEIYISENSRQTTDKYENEFYAADFLHIDNRNDLDMEVLKWGAFRDAHKLELRIADIWAFNSQSTGLLNADELDLCFWNGNQSFHIIHHEQPFFEEDKLTLKLGNRRQSIEILPIREKLCTISEVEQLSSLADLNKTLRYHRMILNAYCLLSSVNLTIENTDDFLHTHPLGAFNHVCQLIDLAFEYPQNINVIADRITQFTNTFCDLADSWSFKTSLKFHQTHPNFKLTEVLPVIKELGDCLAKSPANERLIWEVGYSILNDLIDTEFEETVSSPNLLTNEEKLVNFELVVESDLTIEEKLANFKLVVESDLHPYFGLEETYGEKYIQIKEQVACESLAKSLDAAVSDFAPEQLPIAAAKEIKESEIIDPIPLNSL